MTLANELFQQAAALQRGGDPAGAVELYSRALDAEPDHFDARQMRAALLLAAGRHAEALADLSRCAAIDRGFAPVMANMAACLNQLGRPAAAAAAARRALALRPDMAEAWTALGNAGKSAGHYADALAAQLRAAQLKPAGAVAAYNAGILRLLMGDLARGWPGYERRLQARPDAAIRHRGLPLWNGGPAPGQGVLLWAEQGIGDELVFASCFDDLRPRVERVAIECDPRLVPLYRRSFPWAEVIALDAPLPDGSWLQLPSGSVPCLVRADAAAFGSRASFLRADPPRVSAWRTRLAAIGSGLAVGFLWRGLAPDVGDRERHYTRLAHWHALLERPGLRLVCLQYGDCGEELAALPPRLRERLIVFPDLDLRDDLEGVAALMSAIDLVIGPDTAATALSGAVGCPTWRLALPGDWMSLGSGGFPWMRPVRLFQGNPGVNPGDGWRPVIEAVLRELEVLQAGVSSR